MQTQSEDPLLACQLTDYFGALEAALGEVTRREPETPVLAEGLRYALGLDSHETFHGGKRLRGAICLLVSESLGASREDALPFALAMELLHQFLLVHDDLEDGDRMRRNRPSVWAQYGIAQGTNIGDYLAAKSYAVLLAAARNGSRDTKVLQLVDLLNTTMLVVGRGQARDLAAVGRSDMRLSEYESIALTKTARCWTTALLGAAIVADAEDPVRKNIEVYGNATGLAYQIVDDALDLTVGKGRSEIGSDIREGKRNWLVVSTAERCAAAARTRLFGILDLPRENTSGEDVAWVIDLFEKSDTIALANRRIQQLVEEALASITEVPQPLQSQIGEIARALANRGV